jgi:hypothetical protein
VWHKSNITINKSMLLEIKKERTFVWDKSNITIYKPMMLEIKKVRMFVWDKSNITINKPMMLESKKVRTFVWTEVKYVYGYIWYDICCLIKSRNSILVVDYSDKAMLLLGWSHCYIILRSSSQSCWPFCSQRVSSSWFL